MPDIERLIVRLIGDGSSYQRMIRDAIRISENFGRTIVDVGRSISRLGRNLTLALTLPIVALGTSALNASIQLETMLIRMQALVGSAEQGAEQFEKIKEFSIPSPFLLQDLLNINNRLMGFGMSADEAFESLVRLSDIAALTTNNFNRLALAYGQAYADQRVMGRDINQFVNSSVPLLKLLGDTLGLTAQEIRAMAADGKLSFDLIEEAVRSATDEGGMFFRGTQQLAETTGGKMAQFADRAFLVKAAFGDIIKEAFLPLLEKALELTEQFEDLDRATRQQVISTLKLAAVVGPLLILFGSLIVVLGQTVKLVTSVGAGMVFLSRGVLTAAAGIARFLGPWGTLVALLITGVSALRMWTGSWDEALEAVGGFINNMVNNFITGLRIMTRGITMILGFGFEKLFSRDMLIFIASGLAKAIPLFGEFFQKIQDVLTSIMAGRPGSIIPSAVKGFQQLASDLRTGAGSRSLDDLMRNLSDMVQEERRLGRARVFGPGMVTSFAERQRINVPDLGYESVPPMFSPLQHRRGAAEFAANVGEAAQREIITVLQDSRTLLEEILAKEGLTLESLQLP